VEVHPVMVTSSQIPPTQTMVMSSQILPADLVLPVVALLAAPVHPVLPAAANLFLLHSFRKETLESFGLIKWLN
jgi:hypothetical protein